MLKYQDIFSRFKAPSFSLKSSMSIGIDIGSAYVKLIAIEKKAKIATLKKFATSALTFGAGTLNTLKEFVESQGISGHAVNTSLSGQSVVMRTIALPRMNKDELKGALQFQAKEIIPFPLEEMILDCAITQEKIKDNKMQVVVVAVKKSAVEARVELLGKLGLTPNIIDIDCFCLANAFTHRYDLAQPASANKTETIGLLNVGFSVTNLVILENGAVKFSRDIAFGGQEQSLNSLVSEINSSVDYYENQIGLQIEKVCLSGGSGAIPAIHDFISSHLSLPLVNFDVLTGISVDPALNKDALTRAQGLFAVALGLALR